MRIDIVEITLAFHSLGLYTIDRILVTVPWHHFKLRRVFRGMVQQLQASFPENPDGARSAYFGCRWASATVKPLPLQTPKIDISAPALGQAFLKSSPKVAAKLILDSVTIKRTLIPILVTGVAMGRPVLCTEPS